LITHELKRRVPGGKYTLARAIAAERACQLQSGQVIPLVEVRTSTRSASPSTTAGKIAFRW